MILAHGHSLSVSALGHRNHLEGFLSPLQSFWFIGQGGIQDSAFLTSSYEILMLTFWRPHVGSHSPAWLPLSLWTKLNLLHMRVPARKGKESRKSLFKYVTRKLYTSLSLASHWPNLHHMAMSGRKGSWEMWTINGCSWVLLQLKKFYY